MTEFIAFWIIVLVVATVVATLRDVNDDGLGRRQPPASHHPDPFYPARRLRAC